MKDYKSNKYNTTRIERILSAIHKYYIAHISYSTRSKISATSFYLVLLLCAVASIAWLVVLPIGAIIALAQLVL